MGFGKRTSKALAVLTASLMVAFGLPATALAEVRIDDTVLNAGENAVGGGTAVLSDSSLSMKDVSAQSAWTDESLDVSFEGGNNIETFTVAGDAEVSMEFSGENEVEDIYAQDTSKLAVKADGHNDFEEVNASDKADVFCCEITRPTLKDGYESIVELEFLNRDELKQWISEEKIEDGFTLSALLLYLNSN